MIPKLATYLICFQHHTILCSEITFAPGHHGKKSPHKQSELQHTDHRNVHELRKNTVQTLFIGDKTLVDVKLSKYNESKTDDILKVVHPNLKVNNAANTANYLKTKLYKNIRTVISHVGMNDLKDRNNSELHKHFEKMYANMKKLNVKLVISGPLPTPAMSMEIFSRIAELNEWLIKWTTEHKIDFVDNFDTFWGQPHLFTYSGKNLNKLGALTLSNQIRSSVKHLL